MVAIQTPLTEGRVLTVARAGHDPSLAYGFTIDVPTAGTAIEGFALDVRGWALPREAPGVCVELYYRGELLATTGFKERRDDIVRTFPSAPWADKSGFGTMISLLGVSGQFELIAGVLLQDGRRLPIGGIYGERRPLVSGYTPSFQPIMLTTIGRSGSTWLSHLLGHHPSIMSYRAFQAEPNTLWHWLHILRLMTDPRHYRPPFRGRAAHSGWQITGDDPPLDVLTLPDSSVGQWLDGEAVEASAAICQQRVDAMQQRLADEIGKRRPAYFLEKLAPDLYPYLAWDVYPDAREIMLVRDPRDIYFSSLAFNAARGWPAFGRENAASDEGFAQQLRSSMLAMRRSLQARSDKVLLVRYEDLIQEPQLTLAAILRHLGLVYDLELVREMLTNATESAAQFTFHRTSTSPEDSIGRWRREEKPSLLAACHEAFDDLLAEFGYEPA